MRHDITETEYEAFVGSKVKSPSDIVLTLAQKNLMHAALGVAGEAGEIVGAIKSHTIYGKPLDMENVIEELGDMEFYLQQLRTALNLTWFDCVSTNMAKLDVRYKDGYSDAAAVARADKGGLND